MALQHLRSGTVNKRPLPTAMSDGQLAVNTNLASPGLFFKDGNGDLVKVGPVHIGSTAPNASPASTAATALVANTIYKILTVGTSDFTSVGAGSNAVGVVFTASGTTTGTGTVSGEQGNEKGEMWLDNTGGSYVFKIYDGTAWRSEVGEFVNATGDTMTGDLLFNNANIVFEGSAADDHETTLTVVNPTADRTITLPNVTGTVVTTGDTGTVTSTMLADGTIVNADVNASAAIAGTKVSPDFGSQAITTTGIINANGKVSFPLGSAAAPSLLPGSDTNTGIFSPGADSLAITTAGTQRVTVDSSGRVLINRTNSTGSHNLEVFGGTDNEPIKVTSSDAGAYILFEDNSTTGSTRLGAVANDLKFDVNDTERLRIDSSGNVGIGNVAPAAKLHLEATSEQLRITHTSIASYRHEAHSNGDYSINKDGSERLRIDSSGNVGIGTSSPSARLILNDSTANTLLGFQQSGTTHAYIGTSFVTNGAIIGSTIGDLNIRSEAKNINFSTTSGTSMAMRIDSSGNLLVGKTASNFANQGVEIRGGGEITLTRQGDLLTTRRISTEGTHMSIRAVGGTVIGTISTNGTNASFNDLSDYRFKENIITMSNGIERVKLLKPSRYNFVSNPSSTIDGFLAHEVQSVVPEAVTGEKDAIDNNGEPAPQMLDRSKLIPLLTAALQEAIDEIEILKTKVAALEAG